MPLVEQAVLIFPEHLSWLTVLCGVRVTRSLVLCVCFVDLCLFFCPFSFGHCVVGSSIYGFWLPLWYLLAIVLSVLRSTSSWLPLWYLLVIVLSVLRSTGSWLPLWYLLAIMLSVLRSTDADCPFGIFWPLCCLFFDLRMLITPLVSFGHCVVCSTIYGFWLPLWYL